MTSHASNPSGLPDVAIVAGSSSGVGAATVTRMLNRGVHVVGIDRSDVVPELPAGAADRYVHLVAHAGQEDTWCTALDQGRARFGADPNAVVFCAAVLVIGSVVTLDESDWQSVFETNVFGPARALKHVVPRMAARGGGSVVFVNSSDGLVAEQNLAAYCASKGAGLQLMRAVAVDHARQGIRSNAVCPGSIRTPFFMRHVDAAPDPAAFLAAKTARHPAGRLLEPDDVAAVIDFLAGPASLGMTGTAIPVDGGLTAAFDFYVDQAAQEAEESARRSAELR
jgi:NAD(P)-dependent dehydrogenase (short-subunit alcohol dehydrogenase family)